MLAHDGGYMSEEYVCKVGDVKRNCCLHKQGWDKPEPHPEAGFVVEIGAVYWKCCWCGHEYREIHGPHLKEGR